MRTFCSFFYIVKRRSLTHSGRKKAVRHKLKRQHARHRALFWGKEAEKVREMLCLPRKTVIRKVLYTYYRYVRTCTSKRMQKGGMRMTDSKPKARPAQHSSTLLELLENVIAAQFEMEKTAT